MCFPDERASHKREALVDRRPSVEVTEHSLA